MAVKEKHSVVAGLRSEIKPGRRETTPANRSLIKKSLAPVKKKFLKERQGARGRERREECNGRPEEGKE